MAYYSMVDAASSGVGGGIGQDMEGGAHVSFYVQVENLQRALDQALELGGKLAMPPTAIPGGPTIAMFHDPAGNLTGLSQG